METLPHPSDVDRDLAWTVYAALTRQLPRTRVLELLLQPSDTRRVWDERPEPAAADHPSRQLR